LTGKGEGESPAWVHEAALLARQQLLEPGRYHPIPAPAQTQQHASTQAVGLSANTAERTALDKLIGYWKQLGSHSNVRTIEKAALVVRRFKELIGDILVQEITKQHCSTFCDKLAGLKKADGSPVSITTVNDNIDKLRALFSVAERRGLIQQNPAANLSLKDPVRAKDKRQPFDPDALVRIFSSRIYTAGHRPKAGAGEAAHWLPLLALFTGARLEELGQLHPDDICQEHYENEDGRKVAVWVLRITEEGEGQGLKNAGSTRRVPLHSELIRLGLIKFVEARRGRSRIFYELQEDARHRETGRWSKWFGRWLRGKDCKVDDKRMVFHSFRHGFKDLCREVGIDEPVNDALTGHTGNGNRVARAYGAGRYPLKPLVEGMQKFKLPAEVQRMLNTLPQYRA
jgi:integrase